MRSAMPRLAVFLVIAATFAGPAHACLGPHGLDPNAVRLADLVVVGRIVNYEIVPDEQSAYLPEPGRSCLSTASSANMPGST
jgi:hypothetical protein